MAQTAANDHALVRLNGDGSSSSSNENDNNENSSEGGVGTGESGGEGVVDGVADDTSPAAIKRMAKQWEKKLGHGDVVVCKFAFMFGVMGDFFHWCVDECGLWFCFRGSQEKFFVAPHSPRILFPIFFPLQHHSHDPSQHGNRAIFDKERRCFIEFMGRRTDASSLEDDDDGESAEGKSGTTAAAAAASDGGGSGRGIVVANENGSGGFVEAGPLPPSSPSEAFQAFPGSDSLPTSPLPQQAGSESAAVSSGNDDSYSSFWSAYGITGSSGGDDDGGKSGGGESGKSGGGGGGCGLSSSGTSSSSIGSVGGLGMLSASAMGARFVWGSGAVPLSNALVQATPMEVFVANWTGVSQFVSCL